MKLSEKSWKRIESVYEEITKQPFVAELVDGTLAQEKFLYYIQQDAIYLAEYGRALINIAAKIKNPAHSNAFVSFAKDCIYVENELHNTYLKGVKLPEASPSCMLYTSYIWKQLHTAPVEVAVAAVLPCFWIYKQVGEYILANQTKGENPYQAWINTYGGDEFADAVKLALSIYDNLAENASPELQEEMINAFVYCSKMEWLFWDSAYRIEKWTV